MATVTIGRTRYRYGTVEYSVECGLEKVNDISGNIVDNPVQPVVWDQDQQRYVLYTDDRYPQVTDVAIENPYEDNPDIVLARECWCARMFYNDHGTFDATDVDGSSILEIPATPLFCPMDTNADNGMTDQDVRVCKSRALIDIQEQTILEQKSICYQEDALVEFSKTAWPLCFFWWIILFFILCSTPYGRRVRGYVWRSTCIQVGKMTRTKHRRRQTSRTATVTQEQTREQPNEPTQEEAGIPDEERGTSENTQPTPPPQNANNDEPSEFTPEELRAIEEEFGSLHNYNLLDHELRYQAERTDNQFVMWLWYSAVYSEIRRYRYERFLARRERDRRRRRQQQQQAGEDDASDDSLSSFGGDMDVLRGRRLDSVFWWPPQTPDGRRWENVRNQTSNAARDEQGNPLDKTRLRLKTRRFSLSELPSSCDAMPEQEDLSNPETMDVSEVPENICSICLCELDEGDIVGDIPCGHVFHKDCLKEWLVKNNHCPVCRMPDIARYPTVRQGQGASSATNN